MKTFKVFLSYCLIFAILIGGLPLPHGANSSPIYLNNYTIESESKSPSFEKDERFTLNLEFGLRDSSGISDVTLSGPSTGNFKLIGDVSEKSLGFNNNLASTSFDYIYKGSGSKNLKLSLSYYKAEIQADGSSKNIRKEEDFTIDIYKAREDKPSTDNGNNNNNNKDDKEDDDRDRDKKPHISIVGGKTTLAEAGQSARISIKLKNTSDTSAHNISASLETSDEQGIFISDSGFDTISRLSSDSEKSMSFRVDVDQFAEEKTYPIKVNFNYYNRSDYAFSNTETIYLRVKGDGEDSQLIVDDVSFSKENIRPGDLIWVDFKIRNLSLVPSRDVQLSLEGLESDKISLASGTNKSTIPFFKGRSMQTIRFPLRVSRKIKAGNQPLKLQLNYKNLRGKSLEESHEFFIPLTGSKAQNSSLIIEHMKLPSMIGPNQTAQLSFKIRNRGQSVARDIIVKANLADAEGLVPRSVSTIKLDSLEPGQVKDLSFSFYSTKKTPTKNYPIDIKVEYVDDLSEGDDKYLLEQFVGIFVDNPDSEKDEDAKRSVPKLIIDRYSFSSDMVEAGKKFDLKLSFFNTNRTKSVKNIKIFLTSEENVAEGENSTPNAGSSVFTPVNSSNTFYIDSIAPKGRVEKTITLFTVPDAAAKTHIITANFEYEDAEFNEYKATELIGIPVVQQSKLEVAELNLPPEAFVGEPISLTADFYNTGKATLYNMMVRLEGDFPTEGGSYYIGNFAPGTTDTFDGSIVPDKLGALKGELVFSFEDSLGEEQEIRRPFNINVQESLMIDEEFPVVEEKSFFQKIKWPLIILLLVGAGVFGRKFYKKRRQRKEDEDLLDE